MGLTDVFRPRWKHSNWRVQKAAIAELSDPVVIAEVAMHGMISTEELAKRVTDQALLATVAVKAKYQGTREEVVQLLTDQAILAEL